MHHTALAVRHSGTAADTGDNIHSAVNEILAEYNLPQQDTPVTTDHGSDAAAALGNNVWLDYMCRCLHTVDRDSMA